MTKKTNQKGFTLIELLVALGLFGIVAIMGVSAVLVVIVSSIKSQSTGSILSNLNLSLETMSRNARVGSNYHCGDFINNPSSPSYPQTLKDCVVSSGGSNNITFKSEDNLTSYTYFKSGSTLHKAVDGVDQGSITSPEIFIGTTTFYVIGSENQLLSPPLKTQPYILMIIGGYIDNVSKGKVPFNVQTTISQRVIQ
jgi:prepilin-type N-terminal cleavage/methylation domain-containing protein